MRRLLRVLAAMTTLYSAVPAAAEDSNLEIYVIDVGQGDSTLVVGPATNGRRTTLLIDAGDNRRSTNGAELVRAVLDFARVSHLDDVVLSHYDADHMGGFVQVGTDSDSLLWTRTGTVEDPDCTPTALFPARSVIDVGPPLGTSQSRSEWCACVPQIVEDHFTVEHIQITGAEDLGRRLPLGDGVVAKIVSGRGYVVGNPHRIENADSPNEMSIAVLISTGDGFDFLVTGDLIGVPDRRTREDARLEDALATALAETVDLEVLRIGHHGAKNATSPTFIARMKPEVALISVGAPAQQGRNYFHPRCETLATLAKVGFVIQTGAGDHDCTDKPPISPIVANGTVRITVTRDHYRIDTLPGTSSAGKRTTVLHATCTLDSGCLW